MESEKGSVESDGLDQAAPFRAQRVADRELVLGAATGDDGALTALVRRLTPVVQARVARALLASGHASAATIRQEVEDMVQETFITLFEGGGRVLRSWEPERGLSLENFVGLIATRRTVSILRSGRRSAWREDPTEDEALDGPLDEPGPEAAAASRQQLQYLLGSLRQDLSPQGWQLFDLLYLREQTVEEVTDLTGLSPDAVYAWRSRLRRHARKVFTALLSDSGGSPRRPPRDGHS